MSRSYYSPPPVQENVPAYITKHYGASSEYLKEIIQWSINEYRRGLKSLSRHASEKTLRFFLREYSPMRVLAESEGFRELIGQINERNYNQLSGRERVFLRRAYDLFRALS